MKWNVLLFFLGLARLCFSAEVPKQDAMETFLKRIGEAQKVIFETASGLKNYNDGLIPGTLECDIKAIMTPGSDAFASYYVIDISSQRIERRVVFSFLNNGRHVFDDEAEKFLRTGKGNGVITLTRIELFVYDLDAGDCISNRVWIDKIEGAKELRVHNKRHRDAVNQDAVNKQH